MTASKRQYLLLRAVLMLLTQLLHPCFQMQICSAHEQAWENKYGRVCNRAQPKKADGLMQLYILITCHSVISLEELSGHQQDNNPGL